MHLCCLVFAIQCFLHAYYSMYTAVSAISSTLCFLADHVGRFDWILRVVYIQVTPQHSKQPINRGGGQLRILFL